MFRAAFHLPSCAKSHLPRAAKENRAARLSLTALARLGETSHLGRDEASETISFWTISF
jgi:hypothetical protein